jgi:excisionase family DNA binding protein
MEANVLPLGAAPLMTSREAAAVLQISERKLWSLTKPRGPLPAVRVGKRSVRYAPDDIQRYMEQCRGNLTTMAA